uniref:Transthyretin-like family protein n=1 Tax=Bursaphelenchus xylophilus TaxID=6326 RepID=A0A1I7SK88_BURXY
MIARTLPILFITFSLATAGLIGSTQSAGAKGKLTCNGKPLSGVLIKLYDDDRGLDTDDFMGKTKTDSEGYFELQGHSDEISSIDPKINIYHDCDDSWTVSHFY